VDKRSASTNTGIVMVDALRLSTLHQLLLTLNLMTVRLCLQSGYWQVAQVVSYAFLNLIAVTSCFDAIEKKLTKEKATGRNTVRA
jgi:hypothetical protein